MVSLRTQPRGNVTEWGESYGNDVIILDDPTSQVWNQYSADMGKPVYIVFDRDLTVMFKAAGSSGASQSQAEVLRLLAE
jgi:hypothetical protein